MVTARRKVPIPEVGQEQLDLIKNLTERGTQVATSFLIKKGAGSSSPRELIITPRTMTPHQQFDYSRMESLKGSIQSSNMKHLTPLESNTKRNTMVSFRNEQKEHQKAKKEINLRAQRESFFITGPQYEMFSKTACVEPTIVNNPADYPYPKLPLKEQEVGRTQMQHYGPFWDYYSIFRRHENQWLKEHRKVM